jgi:hypothetical protein
MQKEFIPYELALRMKSIGFNEPCLDYFANGSPQNSWCISYNSDDNLRDFESVARPTFSQCFRWFREKYKIRYVIDEYDLNNYCFSIDDGINDDIEVVGYESYEEAELACLEKLIEIVETKSE